MARTQTDVAAQGPCLLGTNWLVAGWGDMPRQYHSFREHSVSYWLVTTNSSFAWTLLLLGCRVSLKGLALKPPLLAVCLEAYTSGGGEVGRNWENGTLVSAPLLCLGHKVRNFPLTHTYTLWCDVLPQGHSDKLKSLKMRAKPNLYLPLHKPIIAGLLLQYCEANPETYLNA